MEKKEIRLNVLLPQPVMAKLQRLQIGDGRHKKLTQRELVIKLVEEKYSNTVREDGEING